MEMIKSKIDIHVHAVPKRLEGEFGNPRRPESHYICEPEELKDTLKRQSISHAILMSGGESPSAGVHNLGAFNEDCKRITDEYPDFFSWMCNFNPTGEGSVEERMSACKDQGAVGVGEIMVNQWLDSEFFSAIFAAAEKLNLPVLAHMSPEPGFSYGAADYPGLLLLEKTLRRYPDLTFIGHSQIFWIEISSDAPLAGNEARNRFGNGQVKRGGAVERLMGTYPNLYGDLSAFSGSSAIIRDEEYGLYFLERFQNQLLFGTDTLNRYTIFPLAGFLDKHVSDGTLSREAYEKICYKNAQKVFQINGGGV